MIEKYARSIRHSTFLKDAEWLWSKVRPFYDKIMPVVNGLNGFERIINGQEHIIVPACARNICEAYYPKEWKTIVGQVRPGDLCVDVGAYIGLYAVALGRRVGSSGRVYAFEPDSASYDILQQVLRLNSTPLNVETFHAALGAQDRMIKFYEGFEEHSYVGDDGKEGGCEVRCSCLDTVLTDTRIDILKIDTEGFEEKVLEGGDRIFSNPKYRPRFILVETHPYSWPYYGTTSASLLALLKRYGYRTLDLDGREIGSIDSWGWIVCVR